MWFKKTAPSMRKRIEAIGTKPEFYSSSISSSILAHDMKERMKEYAKLNRALDAQFAQERELLGRLCREASLEISPTGFVQVCSESFRPLSVPCRECKLGRELFPGASYTVPCQHSTQKDSQQEAPEKQTLERKIATPQGSKPLRAVDGVVRVRKPRTENATLAGYGGIGILAYRLECRLCSDQDNQTKFH